VPRTGGLVVASNHFSSLDPPVMGVSVPREVNFMAKKELFENRYLRALVLGLRAFPVDRSRSDLNAIRYALKRLNEGVAIGIFAQGTRNAGDVAALDGAAFLAIRAGVPLQPAAIWREGRRYHVRFGVPIQAVGRKRDEMKALTAELMARVNELLPPDRAFAPAAGEDEVEG
jgi:1-acyl-sn-glycerol-3-phosphate acyltransferase